MAPVSCALGDGVGYDGALGTIKWKTVWKLPTLLFRKK
ncbi:unnamed protein product, partial [Rotaria magnacalcarata]